MRVVSHHLYSRKGFFYYRSFMPKRLKPFVPFEEFKLSLNTKDIAQARLYVAQLDIEVNKLIDNIYSVLEQTPSEEGIKKINNLVAGCLDDLRQSVGLYNIRQSPHWYSSALEATKRGKNSIYQTELISQISEEYLKECITNSKKTIEHKRTTYEIFISIIGDLPLKDIKRKHSREYKATLLQMPSNLLKKSKVDSYSQINWNKLPNGDKQSFKTVNSRLTPLIALFTWAERNELYEGSNPFSGLIIRDTKKTNNERRPYQKEELNKLFSCPIYFGSSGRKTHERLVSGKRIYKDYLYFIPLIGLYSGMRLNEICQLEVKDIQKKEDIWCFNINDSDKKTLKTISSKRIVPIHQSLIDLGFLDFVNKQKSKRVFNDLRIGPDGKYSYRFTRLYSRLLTKLEMKKDGLCFHSFRHNFIDALRNSNVERAIAMKLTGHGNASDIHSSYGYGYSLKILQENINKTSFDLPVKTA